MAITRLGLSAAMIDPEGERTMQTWMARDIQSRHVAEAIQYRSLDRRLWSDITM